MGCVFVFTSNQSLIFHVSVSKIIQLLQGFNVVIWKYEFNILLELVEKHWNEFNEYKIFININKTL